MDRPASTMRVVPVMNDESSLARKRIGWATSRGSAQRPRRLSFDRWARSSVSETPRAAARST
jgi:hypothetical protein